MNRESVLIIVLFVLMVTFRVSLRSQGVSADATRFVGVSVYDWWTYEVNFTWLTTSYSGPWWEIIVNIEWVKCTVLNISGTNLTFHQLYHLQNETEIDVYGWIDVDTGHSSASSPFMTYPCIVVSADLEPGDPLYTAEYPFFEWKIDETITKTYVGFTVQTNLLNIYAGDGPWMVYYAKDTGVLCELEYYGSDYSLHVLIVESPIIPELPSLLLLPLLMGATLPVVMIFRRKSKLSHQCDR